MQMWCLEEMWGSNLKLMSSSKEVTSKWKQAHLFSNARLANSAASCCASKRLLLVDRGPKMARKRWWNWNNKSCRLEALHVMCGLDKFGFIYGSSHENYLDLVSAKQTRNMFLFDSFSVILLPEPACSIVCYSFRKNYPMCSGSPKNYALGIVCLGGRGSFN